MAKHLWRVRSVIVFANYVHILATVRSAQQI